LFLFLFLFCFPIQSSRALGWETNDYENDGYLGCGNLSSTTYYHTGYTGTQVCNDPEVRKNCNNKINPDSQNKTLNQ
jgi:hypothetical protein